MFLFLDHIFYFFWPNTLIICFPLLNASLIVDWIQLNMYSHRSYATFYALSFFNNRCSYNRFVISLSRLDKSYLTKSYNFLFFVYVAFDRYDLCYTRDPCVLWHYFISVLRIFLLIDENDFKFRVYCIHVNLWISLYWKNPFWI